MTDIKLSKNKIEELKKEMNELEEAVIKFHEDEKGNVLYSFRDAAAHDVQIKSREKRLEEIKRILKKAKVLPDSIKSNKVVLGSWVSVSNKDSKTRYRIVDPIEADPTENLISIQSPLGKILKNKRQGDSVEFNNTKYTVKQIL